MPRQAVGFTMIELVIVLVIVGIMSVFVVIFWPGQSISLDAQSTQVANDIRYIQNLSMTRNQRFRFNLCPSVQCAPPIVALQPPGYLFSDLAGTGITHPATAPLSSRIALVGGITLAWIGLPNNYIVFDAKGIPYTDNLIPGTPLASDAKITLTTTEGQSRVITLHPETGNVDL